MNFRYLCALVMGASLFAAGAFAQSTGPERAPVSAYERDIGPQGTMIFTDIRTGKTYIVHVTVPAQKEGTVIDGQAVMNGTPTHFFSTVRGGKNFVTFRAQGSLHFGDLRFQEWTVDVSAGTVQIDHAIGGNKQLKLTGTYEKKS